MKIKKLKAALIVFICIAALGISAVLGINAYVCLSTASQILSPEDAAGWKEADCIIILGCQVRADGTPSLMLSDRLDRGIALYKQGAAPKSIMSGDHGQTEYDEVNTMKQYAIDAGVPSEDIFMDHAGFSTYETIYRAKAIFGVKKAIIVTQEYHLYRALYIANRFDIEAQGVGADYRTYSGQLKRDIREVLARCKDFATCIWKPEPTYLGETIPVFGNGDITNDIPT
jgi:vancomycin permeability regulator SanA